MPFQLVAEQFSQEKLPAVANIDCGSDEWGKVANDWIKCVGTSTALSSIQTHGTEVFLYFNEDDNALAGFGSLGLTTRKIKGITHEFSTIPQVGLDTRFHRFPQGVPREQRASYLIMNDLIYRAMVLAPDNLLLQVNKDNGRARTLYERMNFVPVGQVNEKGYQVMVLRLR